MEHLLIFGAVCIATWFLFIYFWPRMMLYVYKRAILVKGFGDGPIPVNTLYTEPQALFADPLHPPASASKLATTGVNRDTLLTVGWLDLNKGPQILHVPDMAGRYYSVQFTDPSKNTNFAYVGKRTTGTKAGDYIILWASAGREPCRGAWRRFFRRAIRCSCSAVSSSTVTAISRPPITLRNRFRSRPSATRDLPNNALHIGASSLQQDSKSSN
jgi:hypothetical protein